MTTDRSANIIIGGEEYTLLLSTKATKEIAGRYGGLENLGDHLMKSENFEMAIGEIVWLIALLANQSILVHNLKHREDPRELLTEEINSFIPYCEGYDGIPFFLSYILVVENRSLLGGKIPHEGVVTSS